MGSAERPAHGTGVCPAAARACANARRQTRHLGESISRSRDVGGYDRHVSVSSQVRITVQRITTLLRSTQLQRDDGAEQWYGIALDAVVDVQYIEGQCLEIREQVETHTKRLTAISITE